MAHLARHGHAAVQALEVARQHLWADGRRRGGGAVEHRPRHVVQRAVEVVRDLEELFRKALQRELLRLVDLPRRARPQVLHVCQRPQHVLFQHRLLLLRLLELGGARLQVLLRFGSSTQ